ncbi:MAG: glycoside hydrolase family protein [Clostridium sp.]|uniref:glycoside hydrolase family protein n=1 Tax=Clostridium sp. TaxID=1506 RepID=UPI003EE4A75D
MKEQLVKQLIRHEGLKLKAYICPAGKLTIGVGRNLEGRGITPEESKKIFGAYLSKKEYVKRFKKEGISKENALYLLDNDIENCEFDLRKNPFYNLQNQVRREVLINMCFNLGYGGLLGFRKFLAAMEKKDYPTAAKEMLDSKWAKQVKGRAIELRDQILKGEYIYD